MTRALLYARQSVLKQGGTESLSLDSQVAQLTARCEAEGWPIIGVIREAGVRGSLDADERPGLAEAIARAEAGDYDILLVWDLSRFFRNLYLQEGIVRQLRRSNVQLVSHTQAHVADDMLRQFEGMVNERRLKDLSAHQKRAIHELQSRGVHHGVVPWGYRRPEPGKPLALDPDVAPLVREMYELRASGVGPAAIAATLTDRGVRTPQHHPTWPSATVCQMLTHIAYRGAVRAGDTIVEGAHAAIVASDLWWRAQTRDADRRGPRHKGVTSWLDGLTEHICGAPMYLNQPTTRLGYAQLRCRDSFRNGPKALAGWRQRAESGALQGPQSSGYEPCPVHPHTANLDRIEPLAWAAVVCALERALDPGLILEQARIRYMHAAPAADAALSAALSRKRRAVERRLRAEELYLSGGRTRAWFDAQDARAAAEQAEADGVLATLPAPPDESGIRSIWEQIQSWRDLADWAVPADRARVLRALGVATVGPAGIKLPGKGGADAGRVSIHFRRELVPFFEGSAEPIPAGAELSP